MPDSGFESVIARELAKRDPKPNPILGHTFVGYRRKGFDEFEALIELNGREQRLPKYTCEKIVKNASPGTETYEASKEALEHWPR